MLDLDTDLSLKRLYPCPSRFNEFVGDGQLAIFR